MNYKGELAEIFNTEKPNYSSITEKEIILYGAGSLGQMAMDLFQRTDITPKYIVDKTKKGEINGVKIVAPEDIPHEDKQNCLFLICISTVSYNEIDKFLKSFQIKNIMQFYTYAYLKFPELLSNGWTCINPTEDEKNQIERVCEVLAHDERSLCHYLQFLWWKIRGIEKIYPKYPVLSDKKFFDSPSTPKLNKDDILLDAGCHFGQTIEKFIKATNNEFKQIYAFEPDEENLRVCKNKFNDERIIYSTKAISDKISRAKFFDNLGYASKLDKNGEKEIETTTIDDIKLSPTIIKLHIEGEELQGLKGAEKTILQSKPTLMVLADHNKDGLYKIPLLMYNYGYEVYFNLHDYCGNSAVFYGR